MIADTSAVRAPRENPAIARQAIVDDKRAVVGYKFFEGPGKAANEDSILIDALADAGTDVLAGKKTVFIRCAFNDLANGHLDLLDASKVVLEIPTLPTKPSADFTTERLLLDLARENGFRLAFDQSVLQPGFESWLPLASFIKIDMEGMKADGAKAAVKSAQGNSKAQVVADQIKSAEQYELMKSFGVKLFQGNWFSKPAAVANKSIHPAQASVIQLINLVREEADVGEIEQLLKRDPTLAFKLLRFINSAGFGLSTEVTSFRHAVMILGLSKLFRWATLLMTVAKAGNVAPAAGTTAVVRGRLMELLAAELMPRDECDNAFVVGVFSLLETLVGVPLEKVLKEINLPQSVAKALLANEGSLATFLALTKACESGDEAAFISAAQALQLSNHQVNWAHLQALMWADQLEG
ncbi:MAG: HDOD domain-containing protein [Variovorax sp.]